jgi:hypothetical protein
VAEADDDPSIDPTATITLAAAVEVLNPYFDGDIYRIAAYVREKLELGDVPLYNGDQRMHPACFAKGMLAVAGGYDPHDGHAYLEITPLTSFQSWVWGADACTFGRAKFEAHLPGAAQAAPLAVPVDAAPTQEPAVLEATPAVATKPRRGRPVGSRPQFALACQALREIFPPDGKVPAAMMVQVICTRVVKHLEDQGLEPPNDDIIGEAVDELRRNGAGTAS